MKTLSWSEKLRSRGNSQGHGTSCTRQRLPIYTMTRKASLIIWWDECYAQGLSWKLMERQIVPPTSKHQLQTIPKAYQKHPNTVPKHSKTILKRSPTDPWSIQHSHKTILNHTKTIAKPCQTIHDNWQTIHKRTPNSPGQSQKGPRPVQNSDNWVS